MPSTEGSDEPEDDHQDPGQEAVEAFDFSSEVHQTVRRLARAYRRYGERTNLGELAETVYSETEDLYETRAEQTWTARALVEGAIGRDFADVFHTFDIVVGASDSAFRLLEGLRRPEDGVPDSVAYAMTLLRVRALRVAHEVSALLRAGFASGAGGRWRTLYEVYITAAVLSQANQHTCTRFNEHRWIMLARDHRRMAQAPQLEGPTPEQMRRRLIARFGANYDGTYGWAAELTKRRIKVERPKFGDLERLAAMDPPHKQVGAPTDRLDDPHRTRLLAAHHRVHADALGVLDLVDGSGVFHSGALYRGIAGVAYETVHVLGECMRALVYLRSTYAPESAETTAVGALLHELFMISERHLVGHAVRMGDLGRGAYLAAVAARRGDP